MLWLCYVLGQVDMVFAWTASRNHQAYLGKDWFAVGPKRRRPFVLLSSVYFAFVSWFSLLNPFLETMSFAGYFHARVLLSVFFPVFCCCCFSPTVFVPALFWCNFLYLVTTAGFVADQLM